MVFSQTSHKTQCLLKVVELNRLKPEKSQQVNGSTGVVTDGHTEAPPCSPSASASFAQVFLKEEPLQDSTMLHELDSELYQDLESWCSTPAKEEQLHTIDFCTSNERAQTLDTAHTSFSPQGWDGSTVHYNQAENNILDLLTPNTFPYLDNKFIFPFIEPEKSNKNDFQERFIDIGNLPVVLEDVESQIPLEASAWPPAPAEPEWYHTTYTNTLHTQPFIEQEDTLDSKCLSIIPREMEDNNLIVSDYVIKYNDTYNLELKESGSPKNAANLALNVTARAPFSSEAVSTPEILTVVEQLENDAYLPKVTKPAWAAVQETSMDSAPSMKTDVPSSPAYYEPVTPTSESHMESDHDDVNMRNNKKRRHEDSEDSDYIPSPEEKPRKYRRRRPNVPIKDMIQALEDSQPLIKARRGRPPKRRESTVSSVCSIDDNGSSISTQESKYRELRDKNNEASKRSRMNRKLKELQMEKLAIDLEERNKELQIKVDTLQNLANKLRHEVVNAFKHGSK